MLEYRFDLEKKWAAAGGNIRSRAFFRELEKGYQQHFYPGGKYFTGPEYQTPVEWLLSFATDEDSALLGRSFLDDFTPKVRPRKPKYKKYDMIR